MSTLSHSDCSAQAQRTPEESSVVFEGGQWRCGTDVSWPVLAPVEFIREATRIHNSTPEDFQIYVCRHMIQAGD